MIKHTIDCVFIETTTACTRKCPWCTHHYYDIKPQFMSEELFQKIIEELSQINYSGRLSFYLNGEPLLDKRLADWVKIGKKACPNAFTFIISNGDLFKADKITTLINSGLDGIKVNTYDETTLIKVQDEMKKIDSEIRHHVRLFDHSKKTDWTSRGGTVPFGGNIDEKQKKMVCLRPFKQIYISVTGIVAQCCSDALNKYVMGDVNKQSILDIWNGEAFNRVRMGLVGKAEPSELCKICDLERTYEDVNDLKNLFVKNANNVINETNSNILKDTTIENRDFDKKSIFFKNSINSIKKLFSFSSK